MTDLTDFLLARIAEDERTVAAIMRMHPRWSVAQEEWVEGVGVVDDSDGSVAVVLGDYAARHIARWDPARVLAECEAKRRIVEEWQQGVALEDAQGRPAHLFDPVHSMLLKFTLGWLRLLARPYADHPDYREEWRP